MDHNLAQTIQFNCSISSQQHRLHFVIVRMAGCVCLCVSIIIITHTKKTNESTKSIQPNTAVK